MISVVAVPVVFLFGEPYFVLIRRSRNLSRHANQIAFPGGIVEQNESLQQAMFRELEEEIGVSEERCKFLGTLSSTITGKSNLFVQAFLVQIDKPHFRLNKFEVQDVYFVGLSMLRKTNCEEIVLPKGGKTCKFVVDDLVIWGATARIIKDSLPRIVQLLETEGCTDEFSRHQSIQPS